VTSKESGIAPQMASTSILHTNRRVEEVNDFRFDKAEDFKRFPINDVPKFSYFV